MYGTTNRIVRRQVQEHSPSPLQRGLQLVGIRIDGVNRKQLDSLGGKCLGAFGGDVAGCAADGEGGVPEEGSDDGGALVAWD